MAGCSTTETARDGMGSQGACWASVVDAALSMFMARRRLSSLETLAVGFTGVWRHAQAMCTSDVDPEPVAASLRYTDRDRSREDSLAEKTRSDDASLPGAQQLYSLPSLAQPFSLDTPGLLLHNHTSLHVVTAAAGLLGQTHGLATGRLARITRRCLSGSSPELSVDDLLCSNLSLQLENTRLCLS
jgi:hypothetical protein